MSRSIAHTIPPVLALLVALGVAACGEADSPLASVEPEPAYAHAQPTDAEISRELAALRQATARLHRLEDAIAEGWDAQVTGCIEHPTEGGMGYHYANFDLYLDGEADALAPEVLLYEPQEDGNLLLVAVEYAVPFFAWDGDPDVDDPPTVFGQPMKGRR